MTWTDGNGVTHAMVAREGYLQPGTCSRRWNAVTWCGLYGPIGAKTSSEPTDCMTCLVKEK